jgi:hypothetical protein
MGAGGVVQQNAAIKQAVNDPSIYGVLPPTCKARVDVINAKPLIDWTEADYAYMCDMPVVARHC